MRITFVGRLLPVGWQYSHANQSDTANPKEDVKQKFFCCDVIWTLISWFLSSSNFWESLTPHSHSKNKWSRSKVVITVSEKQKKTGNSCNLIYSNIYLCVIYFIWFTASYTMRSTCVPRKVRRLTKFCVYDVLLNFFARSTDFCVPEPYSV